MKLTKRQLRRIIRENIRDTLDMAGGLEDYEVAEMSSEFFIDELMAQEYASGRYDSVDELLANDAAYEELAMTAMEQFPQLSDDEFDLIWNNAEFVNIT